MRSYFRALETGDWERLAELCAEDVCYHLPGEDPRFARAVRWRSVFLRFAQDTFAQFPQPRFEVGPLIRSAGGVVARYQGSWRQPGGERATLDGMVRFQLREGRIQQIGVRIDLKALTAQMARD